MLDKLEKVQAWSTWLAVAISLFAAIKAAWLAEWYACFGWMCSALWAFNARLSQRSSDRYRHALDSALDRELTDFIESTKGQENA